MNKEKIISLLNLSSSENDNEALSAIRTANKIIKKNNMSWSDFFEEKEYYSYNKENRPNEKVILNFGKYKGQTILDVSRVNYGYLEWCAKNIENNYMRNAISCFLRGY